MSLPHAGFGISARPCQVDSCMQTSTSDRCMAHRMMSAPGPALDPVIESPSQSEGTSGSPQRQDSPARTRSMPMPREVQALQEVPSAARLAAPSDTGE